MDNRAIKKFQARLAAMKVELEALSQATAEARKPVMLDQQAVGRVSRIDALQGQAMQVETESRRRREMARIEAALARMEEGEYGVCVACDEEIDPRRLDNDPAAATCIDCAGT